MCTLYVVATPIGNMGDISARAAEVLRSVPVVIAEDTRVARKLLDKIEASPRLVSYHRHSSEATVERIVAMLTDTDAALISDAGTPGVNDPGAELVAHATAMGIAVTPLPGPSAIMAALSVSGFSCDRFVSFGYLPASRSKRRRVVREIAECRQVAVCFEAPHRVCDALADLADAIPERQTVVCRELTKLHEEIWRGTVADASAHFASPRGEFVVVFAPSLENNDSSGKQPYTDAEILEVADSLAQPGMSTRDLAQAAAVELGISRREVYQVLIKRE